ncbi:hypothetical protein GOBAR_AA36259 [Gossypium barbadense]|uniref:non-specific serine/threonine protein kinase n=1 Tax=Gossypium barbadense TaxID=3634 RepID=A0A2P5W041_GOSBA|nr:hypothetical protein GOBAR_AA36259 [Gossypium barbadense]
MSTKTIILILICLTFHPLLGGSQGLPRFNNNTDQESLVFKSRITDDPLGVLETWNPSSSLCNWTSVNCNVTKQRVTSINLENLGLVGTIAPHIGNLSFLSYLNLQNNSLSGSLPQEIGQLFRLRTLILASNRIRGTIPASLSLCSKLPYLDLSINRLEGTIPNELGALSELEDVSFMQNFLTGPIPSSLGNLSYLSNLILRSNSLKGPIPEGLGRLPFLINLQIGLNNISGEICRNNGSSKNQTKLQNRICKTEARRTLPNLQYIFLHENKFSGKVPESLGNLTYLAEVHLSNNLLEGTIPSSLGNCQRLQLLDLSVNLLNGTIPGDIFGIPGLGKVLNLSFNSLSGFVPSEVGDLNMVQAIDLASNQLSGDIPVTIGDCSSLLYLNMSRNSFQGSIPNSLDKLKAIEYIDLSSNNLTGNISASLESLKFLQVLNLSRNQLSGEVPKGGIFENSTAVSLSGNLKLCGGVPNLGLPKCDSHEKKSGGSKLKIVLAATFASVAFIIIVSMLVFWLVRKKDSDLRAVNEKANSPEMYPMCRQHDLKLATRNFSPEYMIGEGSFGSVYKGVFEDGSLAAIKVFKMGQHGASKSFIAECEALRSIRHRNLVKIISVCSAGDFKALVLKFMPNGNLEQLLHPRIEDCEVEKVVDMNQRLKIAQDVALALEYLHHDCESPVVHCDLKPSNVLLDEEMSAHVGDFGLARILLKNSPNAHLSISVGLKGSIGYMAPVILELILSSNAEYGMGAGVSTRGDVYSFGILILEMFTRKRPIDHLFSGDMDLQKWVSMHLPDHIYDIVDNELKAKEWQAEHADGMARILNIGLMCARKSPEERPTMREVSVMIKKCLV